MKARTALAFSFLLATTCFADNLNPVTSDPSHDGFFLGLGGNFNSINLTQNSWGKGISNIQTSTGANSNGVAEGDGAPFHNITNAMGPNLQFGYFKHIANTPNLAGIKFSYQYLNSTATNSNLYIPQIGQTTSAITGVTTPLVGYVNATSVQPLVNQELMLLLFAGHSFGNTTLYFGAGPLLVNLRSSNYYSIGYANYEGATINVTGLVSYSTPSLWAWGAAAQLGAIYNITPSWFVDLSYTYAQTGNCSSNHQQGFVNASSIGSTTYTTSGTLITKNTLSVINQTIMFSINKVFDL